MEPVIFHPTASPLLELVRTLRDEREGPAGDTSFRCWNGPRHFDWLAADAWCVRCGAPVAMRSPHVCSAR